MVIISSKPGQLGNSLFLFAHFIAFSIEYSIPLRNPAFDAYAHYFPATQKDFFHRYPARSTAVKALWLRGFIYTLTNLFARMLNRLRIRNRFIRATYIDWHERVILNEPHHRKAFTSSSYVFALGWAYRTPELVKKHFSSIHSFFRPHPVHLSHSEELIRASRMDCEVLIGIHIRHGDYIRFEGGRYYYSSALYLQFMQQLEKLFPGKRVKFLVCTNSKEDMTALNALNHIKGTGHELEDLYSFSLCDYLAGPPSTYTMWASFYGNVPLLMIRDAEQQLQMEDFRIAGHG